MKEGVETLSDPGAETWDALCCEEPLVMWPQEGADNRKCTGEGQLENIASQADCQRIAMENSHPFYSYSTSNNKCSTVADCNSPISGTSNPWKIYRNPESVPDPTAVPAQVWSS